MVYPCMCCTAAPPISRPSDKHFLEYAKEGRTEQVADDLRHYPDLVQVQNSVSYWCYYDEDCFHSLCDCQLCVNTLDDICRHPSTLPH